MEKQTSNNIRLGIFVTLAMTLFIAAIYYIGNRQNLFGTSFHVSTVFTNINGLQTGNNVRYNGINVGSVEKIFIESDSTVRVILALKEEMKNFIKSDATATIGSDGLVGNMLVNINPGKESLVPVEEGGEIASFTRIDPNDLLKTLGNTNENIAILSLNLLEITEKLNEGKGTLPMLIRDDQMAKNVQAALLNLNKTSRNVEGMTHQMQTSVESVLGGEGMLGHLLKDTTFMYNLTRFTARLDTQLVVKTEPFILNLEESSKAILAASTELEKVMQSINEGDGTVATMLNDSASATDIKEILKNVEKGTAKFDANMEALKHNFLFRRYFKKQEKARKKELKNKKAEVTQLITYKNKKEAQ